MEYEKILRALVQEAAVIASAPISFAVSVLISSGVAYLIAKWMFSTVLSHRDARISSLEERIKLRDDQLSNHLQNVPPDAAKLMIKELEARLDAMRPRRLTADQRASILSSIRSLGGGHRAHVVHEATCPDCAGFASDFQHLLADAGWSVDAGMVLGIGNPPRSGIGVLVNNAASPNPLEAAVISGLRSAHIEFDIQSRQGKRTELPAGIEILIASKR